MYNLTADVILLLLGVVVLAILTLPKKDEVEEEDEIVTTVVHKRKEFPYNFKEFIGQGMTLSSLHISISVAKKLKEPLPHTLFYGLPGLGKTTLAEIVAQDMGVNFISIEGVSLDSKEAVLQVVNQIDEGTIVFIDEIHQMRNKISEIWYKIMENFTIDIIGDQLQVIDVPRFTTIGATTDFGKLLKPFRDRFVHKYELRPYSVGELTEIVEILTGADNNICKSIATISQNTPRLAKAYIQTVKEYAIFNDRSVFTASDFTKLLELKQLTPEGLTPAQLRVLRALLSGNVLGKLSLATAAELSVVDLEQVAEPYLVTEKYIVRTPRGRTITEKGIKCISSI